jgi:ribose transport system ATP-binding protein
VCGDVASGFSIQNLSVRYTKRPVLQNVSLVADRGQMIALLGPNGSGKSTLLKTLAGVVRPEPGATIRIGKGRPLSALTPSASRQFGLRFVHQDLGLIPELTVLDNFFLPNAYPRSYGRVNWKSAKATVQSALDSVYVDASPKSIVNSLPPSSRVLIATARALFDLPQGGGFVFVDEPTAALGEDEANSLLQRLSDLTSQGSVGTCFVTHRLHEVREFSERIAVLRDGEVVLDDKTTLISEEQLLRALGSSAVGSHDQRGDRTLSSESNRVGSHEQIRDRTRSSHHSSSSCTALDKAERVPALELVDVSAAQLRQVSLTVAPGEIVGLTGLEGSGAAELVSVLFGETPIHEGSIRIGGERAALRAPTDAVRHGLGLVPRERSDGGIEDLTLGENLVLPDLRRLSRNGWLGRRRMLRQAEAMIEAFDIRPPDPSAPFWTLSGGNQQKAIVARWLWSKRTLLVLHEPTAGVDVGSRARLYEELRCAARESLAILLVSSDLSELEALCDRAIVLVDGKISSEFERSSITRAGLAGASFTANSPVLQLVVS